MVYARIVEGIVVETWSPPEGFGLDECFHPDVAKTFVLVPEALERSVSQDWTYDGVEFRSP